MTDLYDLAVTEQWMREGLCAQTDPEIFFPHKGGRARTAYRVCAVCPVAAQCLEYAISVDLYGVWGGTSQQKRRKLRRERQAAA